VAVEQGYAEWWKLIPGDAGRPITDIRMKVNVPDLDPLLSEVVDSVTSKEREVQAKDGRWYALRLRPYLTLEGKIDGAVLMMTDVDAIRHARDYAESIVETVRDPLMVLDSDLRVVTANRAFYRTFRVEPGQVERRRIYELIDGQWDIPDLRRVLEEMPRTSSTLDNFIIEGEFSGVGQKTLRLSARKLTLPAEDGGAILLAMEDISEVSRLETAARESAKKFKLLFDRSPLPKWIFEIESLRIVEANEAAVELYGYSRDELLTMRAPDLCTPDTGEALCAALAHRPHRPSSTEISQHRKRSGGSSTSKFAAARSSSRESRCFSSA
jgi:PAS domain S-box-containing protein